MTESCHSGLRLPGDGHEMIEIDPTIPNDISGHWHGGPGGHGAPDRDVRDSSSCDLTLTLVFPGARCVEGVRSSCRVPLIGVGMHAC
jgi:hypothetical protein